MTAMDICSLLWTFLGVVWLIAWLFTKRAQERAPIVSRLLYGVPIVVACYLAFGSKRNLGWLDTRLIPHTTASEVLRRHPRPPSASPSRSGRASTSDKNWSSAATVKVGHELIRTGPYAWVRHPIYSGLLLAMIGTAFARPEPRRHPRDLLYVVGLWIKSRLEEQFMRKTFGPDYEDYSQATGALIPRLRL